MKRVLLIILCVLSLTTLMIPASAAGNTAFSMSASKTTLHRGDTVTYTVSVSGSEPATSYGFMLSYDSSVLELVEGSCTVTGTLVSSFNNGFAFMFQNATAYTGTVGTVTFRVKDSAAYGNYTVSGSASVKNGSAAISAFGSSGTVVIACNHSYGSWNKVNDSTHKRTCSACKKDETVNHTWNSGTVTKQPTCKETGIKTYTCTGCNATKTETINKSNTHTFGNWSKLNNSQHKHTCSVCQKEETVNHNWNSGKVTKQPSCKETGVKTYTCTGCNATKTETINKTNAHSFGNWVSEDVSLHKHVCSACGKEETANHCWNSGSVTKQPTCKEEGVKVFTCTGCNATKTERIAKLQNHTYDNGCDTNCNFCGVTRFITHNYKSTWNKDKNNHWHECTVCKERKDEKAHTPGVEATETTPQSCTECGYVIKAALGHTHQFETAWSFDENGHWFPCPGCEVMGQYASHDFENPCDTNCTTCEFTRDVTHNFEERWTTDEESHWHVCISCGEVQNKASHEPGAEATATTAKSCTICNYEITPALGEPEAPDAEKTQTPIVEADQKTSTDLKQTPEVNTENSAVEDNKTSYGWIVIAAAAVVAAGAAVIIVKKKKD